jgi:hypothetical protein
MIKHLIINFTCVAKSIALKFISAVIVLIVGIKLNVYSIPLNDAHLLPYILLHLMVSYLIIFSPLQYFVTYLLHDIKMQIFIDYENDSLRIIESKVEYLFHMSEVLKITKFFERRSHNNFLGYFYYKIETTKGSFYISMFTSWTLNKVMDLQTFSGQKVKLNS